MSDVTLEAIEPERLLYDRIVRIQTTDGTWHDARSSVYAFPSVEVGEKHRGGFLPHAILSEPFLAVVSGQTAEGTDVYRYFPLHAIVAIEATVD